MNEQHPYEKHLADKLHHLPPPGDMNGNWEQMKTLLDKEMPRGGGIPNRRRWWVLGLLVGILFLATWLAGEHFGEGKGPGDQLVKATPAAKGGEQSAVIPGKADRPAGEQVPPRDEGYADAGAARKPVTGTEATTDPTEKDLVNNNEKEKRTTVDEAIITPEKNTSSNRTTTVIAPNATAASNSRPANSKGSESKPVATKNNRRRNRVAPPANAVVTNTNNSKAQRASGKGYKPGRSNNNKLVVTSKVPDSKPAEDNVRPSKVKAPLRYIDARPEPALYPGPQIQKDYAFKSGLLPSRPVPAATAAKKKMTRSREAGTFAAGFTLPLAFPMGDQRAMGYNYWGGHNTVSDYLPSPQLQYHLNEKTFFQTEAQFLAPQFIRSTLLRNEISGQTSGYYTTHATFARKLYYFNIPLSIHFSPFPGFYMGSGLQYSAMLGGVSSTEERKWSPGGVSTLVKEEFGSFRRSTYSKMIRNDEFRLLLDANYYWNKFTVGMRYNQALTNYISFRLAPSMPYSFEKNRGLQFYLRYNLWEQQKGANINKTKTILAFK